MKGQLLWYCLKEIIFYLNSAILYVYSQDYSLWSHLLLVMHSSLLKSGK